MRTPLPLRILLVLLAVVALWMAPQGANAAPFMVTAAYPATGPQPDSASVTINGGAPVPCVIETISAGKRPKCDLGSITTPGTYTLVLTLTKSPGIVNTTGGATNDPGGVGVIQPFRIRLARLVCGYGDADRSAVICVLAWQEL